MFKKLREMNRQDIKWAVLLAAIIALVLIPLLSKGAQLDTLEFNGDTGMIAYGAEICKAETITPRSIVLLDEWQSLVNRLEATQLDGVDRLTQDERERGYWLSETDTCITVAMYYSIIVLEEVNDYLLIEFDPQYGFDTGKYILRRLDFFPDREV